MITAKGSSEYKVSQHPEKEAISIQVACMVKDGTTEYPGTLELLPPQDVGGPIPTPRPVAPSTWEQLNTTARVKRNDTGQVVYEDSGFAIRAQYDMTIQVNGGYRQIAYSGGSLNGNAAGAIRSTALEGQILVELFHDVAITPQAAALHVMNALKAA